MNKKAEKILKMLQDTHALHSNTLAIDYGYKYINGQITKDMAIRFHVGHKLPMTQLDAKALIPPMIQGIPTDIIEVQSESLYPNGRLQPGTRVARPHGKVGTLGAIVKRGEVEYLLSCWHILALSSSSPRGGRIEQPDQGIKIAEYEAHAMAFGLDAAIAQLTTTQTIITEQYISGAKITRSRSVKKGDILEKVGAKTGKTRALVDGLSFGYSMPFGAAHKRINCFRLVPIPNEGYREISDGGDSGALWYDPITLEGVGLNIAGEADNDPKDYSLACPISDILTELNLTLA